MEINNNVGVPDAPGVAREIVYFNDGRIAPKNDSRIYNIIKTVFYTIVIILIIGSFIVGEFLLAGESISVWVCFFIIFCYLIKNGGHERIECPSQLQLFDDYLIFFVPKHHIKAGRDQMEIQKIYYSDVIECEFRTITRKFVICGMIDEVDYGYDKQGNVKSKPCYKKRYDGMIKFYTVFDNEHDFKEIIERNSPLKVRYDES